MIELTAAYNPGSLDDGESYTHVEVQNVSKAITVDRVNISVVRGYLNEGSFVTGKADPINFQIVDNANADPAITDMTDLKAILSTASEGCYDADLRAIDQWLINKGHFPGTVAP